MNQYATMIRNLKSPEVMERLIHLYGRRDGMLVEQTGRYIGLLKRHEELFHENREVLMISAPGRTEIGGNHTDHNRGRVLWAVCMARPALVRRALRRGRAHRAAGFAGRDGVTRGPAAGRSGPI